MSFCCLFVVQAASAYAGGKREYAAYLSEQVCVPKFKSNSCSNAQVLHRLQRIIEIMYLDAGKDL